MSEPSFRILRSQVLSERADWLALWDACPRREVFAHPAYLDLHVAEGEAALAATASVHDVTILYPFLLRPVPRVSVEGSTAVTDISGPYGYGGPYAWGTGDRLAAAATFWPGFDSWALDAGAVSEFVRFDLHPESLLPFPGSIAPRSMNVIRSLDMSVEQLWMDVAHKVRKNVKRARSRDLTVVLDEHGDRMGDFHRIYIDTMERRDAQPAYHFTLEWLQRLTATLPGQWALFHVLRDDDVVSSELVLRSAKSVYSFLGGTDPIALQDRANDLLKWEVILWARGSEMSEFVLGGGREPDDGIFRYKASFAPSGIVPFRVGTRVLDEPRYRALTERAAHARKAASQPGFFPNYRA